MMITQLLSSATLSVIVHTTNAWKVRPVFFYRLLNFGRSEIFVVTVATQSLEVTSANLALRKILKMQQILIIRTSRVPTAHAVGPILIQKPRSKLK